MDSPAIKLNCERCDAEILISTYEKTGGFCIPCKKRIGSKVFIKEAKTVEVIRLWFRLWVIGLAFLLSFFTPEEFNAIPEEIPDIVRHILQGVLLVSALGIKPLSDILTPVLCSVAMIVISFIPDLTGTISEQVFGTNIYRNTFALLVVLLFAELAYGATSWIITLNCPVHIDALFHLLFLLVLFAQLSIIYKITYNPLIIPTFAFLLASIGGDIYLIKRTINK